MVIINILGGKSFPISKAEDGKAIFLARNTICLIKQSLSQSKNGKFDFHLQAGQNECDLQLRNDT